VPLRSFTGVGLLVNRHETHQPHQTPDPLLINHVFIIAQMPCHLTHTVKRGSPGTACLSGASDQGSFRSRPSAHSKMTTARSTATRIACRQTDLEGSAQSSCASPAGPGFALFCQKIVGDGQLPDLGMEVFDLLFINFRCLPAATFKYA